MNNDMAKVQKLHNQSDEFAGYLVFCPGCECYHLFDSRWTFNGDFEKPTFDGSMLVNKDDPTSRCHSFLTNGEWQFLQDCFHHLAGQTVDLVDLDLS